MARSFTSDSRLIIAAALFLVGQVAASAQSASEVFQAATRALQQRDYKAAEQGFKTVLESEPKNIEALGNLGVIYSRTHREADAIETYRRALKLDPDNQGLRLNLALAFVKQQQYPQALPNVLQVIKQDPSNTQAQELTAMCQVFSGQETEAATRLERLRNSDPHKGAVLYLLGVAYTRMKRPEQAKVIFTELLSASATSPDQSNFLLGKAYYDGGLLSDAEESLRKVLAASPDFPGARLELAKVYISERENEKAAQELRRVLTKDARDPEASYYLGALLVQENRYREAEPFLKSAEENGAATSWAVAYYLGKIALKTGKPNDAVSLLERSARENPDEASVYYLLAQAFRSSGREREAQAALAHVRSIKTASIHKEAEALSHVPGTH